MTDIMLVAATATELRGHDGLVCGVGPVEAAACVAVALERRRPSAVVHVGIAGAHGDAGLAPGGLVVGERAVYEDRTGDGLAPREAWADARLVAAAASALAVTPVAIGTTARVGGSGECGVEAMEGFAVLRACELAGVPAVEVRAISNYVDDARADWRIDDALDALGAAIPVLLRAVESVLPTGG